MADEPVPAKPRARRAKADKPAEPKAAKPRAKNAAAASAQPAVTKPKAGPPKTPAKPRKAAPPKEEKASAKPRAPRKASAAAAAPSVPATPPPPPAAAAAPERASAPTRVGPIVAAAGALAAIGGAVFLWRASRADQPDYQVVESDGPIEIRKYPALVTAAAIARGERKAALDQGFRQLVDYLAARSRPGKKLAMIAPVLADEDDGVWRTRFIMPLGTARAQLPVAPEGIELASEPARRVAAMRFSGRADDAMLEAKEGALRSWLQLRGLPSEGKAAYAFYNAPVTPGRLRRNEVLITLSDEGGTGA